MYGPGKAFGGQKYQMPPAFSPKCPRFILNCFNKFALSKVLLSCTLLKPRSVANSNYTIDAITSPTALTQAVDNSASGIWQGPKWPGIAGSSSSILPFFNQFPTQPHK